LSKVRMRLRDESPNIQESPKKKTLKNPQF